MSTKNQKWLLKQRPDGMPKTSDFAYVEEDRPEPNEGEFLIKTLYISLDPAQRGWMSDNKKSYIPPIPLGDPVRSFLLGQVETSKHPDYQEGDYVYAMLSWQTYHISNGKGITKINAQGIPVEYFMGALGMQGATAYFGLTEVAQAKEGEVIVISGAAGAVGSLVGQMAKILGLKVIGIAGSEAKCQWMEETLGFDGSINYKSDEISKKLRSLAPEGVDIYFENAGGSLTQIVLNQMRLKGRIAICGLISEYNGLNPPTTISQLGQLIAQRIRIEGFLVTDFMKDWGKAFQQMGHWIAQGKLKVRLEVVEGFEKTPETFNWLFEGKNTGKLTVKV